MNYIPRLADKEILRFIEDKQPNKSVLLVEGARQVGKSFLVAHAIQASGKQRFSLNLEKETRLRSLIDDCREFKEFDQLLRDRIGFDSTGGQALFFDQAQESSRIGQFVRFMKEDWAHATVMLCGSTLSRLFRQDTRYPVGRVRRLLLGPLAFSEFLIAADQDRLAEAIRADESPFTPQRHDHLLSLYDRFLLTGGLPAVVLESLRGGDRSELLAQILADYEQDFIRLFGEADAEIVRACFRSVANFVGRSIQEHHRCSVAEFAGQWRINEVFDRLEGWHLILRSDQKGQGAEAGHAYLPKRYLFDSGVLRHLREVAVPSIHILETLAPENKGVEDTSVSGAGGGCESAFVFRGCGHARNPALAA